MRRLHAIERRMCGKEIQLGTMDRTQDMPYSNYVAMVYYSRSISRDLSMRFSNPAPEEISKLLNQVHSVAVVGLSPNPARPSFRVAQGLRDCGYRILPVRPMVAEVLGEKAFPDLESLSELPDIVDVFRAMMHVPDIVESCIKIGVKNLWLQEGIIHEEAAQRARKAGINVVMNRCMWRDAMKFGAHNSTSLNHE
jgi:predicted CoA-binding protein